MTSKEFKEVRLRMGLTQAKMAATLGVSTRTVQHYEGGTRKISHPIELLLYFYEFKFELSTVRK